MYLDLTLVIIHVSCSFSYVSYELFEGFGVHLRTPAPEKTSYTTLSNIAWTPGTRKVPPHVAHHTHSTTPATLDKGTGKIELPVNSTNSLTITHRSILPVTAPYLSCYEAEEPISIGTYEVPSQRDLVQLIRKTLVRMFNSYREKTLLFLKDIREATKATAYIEKQCFSSKQRLNYKACVKRIGGKCETITKILVTSLERQRLDVSDFIEERICNLTAMTADPMRLIKVLAMEDAALEFALPSFLRLLGQCSAYCNKLISETMQRRPLRHMTDQELVVRHFLSKKTYKRILKNTKKN